jgi:hypothetical protein
MVKSTLAVVGLLAATSLNLLAQGTVILDTKSLGEPARIQLPSGVWATGPESKAQLYAAAGLNASESSLQPVGPVVPFRAGINAGFISATDPITIPFAAPGGPVTVQLRAWFGPAASYEAAGPNVGKSVLLNLSVTGNPLGQPPTVPVELTGLSGFMLVPEPSSLALGALGAAALLFSRRKRK